MPTQNVPLYKRERESNCAVNTYLFFCRSVVTKARCTNASAPVTMYRGPIRILERDNYWPHVRFVSLNTCFLYLLQSWIGNTQYCIAKTIK